MVDVSRRSNRGCHLALAVTSVLLFGLASAQLHYQGFDGRSETLFAPQLWYNGYWKHPGWINLTMVDSKSASVQGKVVLLKEAQAPYERFLRPLAAKKVAGIVVVRDRSGEPGQNMYFVDLSDQSSINVPVVEVFQSKKARNSLFKLPENVEMSVNLYPEVNPWKTVNENKFQLVANIVLSLLELGIISIAIYRLVLFWRYEGLQLSLAQVCLTTELIATLLRLGFTMVDPFWTYRIYHNRASMFLLTLHMPFSLTAGILLTFFWAESLTMSSVKVKPFISDHKVAAFVVIGALFIIEIVCDLVRIYVASSTALNPNTITGAVYLVVSLILAVCYILCAYKILKKIGRTSIRHSQIRRMTLRFLGSTSGYIILVIVDIYSLFKLNNAWPFKIICNLMFLCFNFSALLQVLGFRPVQRRSATGKSSGIEHNSHRSSKGAESLM